MDLVPITIAAYMNRKAGEHKFWQFSGASAGSKSVYPANEEVRIPEIRQQSSRKQ